MDSKRIHLNNLMFLLAAAPMAVGGCIINSTSDDDDTAGTTPVGTGDDDGGNTSTAGTGGGSGDETAGPATSDSTGAPATSDGSGSGDTTTTGGKDIDVECTAYGETVTTCYDAKAGEAAYVACTELRAQVTKYSEACETAFEDFYACLAALDCKDFGPGTGCERQDTTYNETCFPE